MPTLAGLVVEPLYQHPAQLAAVAAWHHSECRRQGLDSTLVARRQRLQDHLGYTAIPRTLVALLDARLVGCVSLVRYQYRPASASAFAPAPVWLSNLYVVEDARQRGVGTALIDTAVNYARQLHLPELWLSSADQTAFYQRRGWQPVRRTYLGAREVEIMRLPLQFGSDATEA